MVTTGMIHVRGDEDVKGVAIGQTFPFPLKVPNPVTQAAMEEARAIGQARFASSGELLDSLGQTSEP